MWRIQRRIYPSADPSAEEDEARDRRHQHVERADKAGFSNGRERQTVLLDDAADRQVDPADHGPWYHLPDGKLLRQHFRRLPAPDHSGDRDQYDPSEKKPDRREGEWSQMIHSGLLRYESGSENKGGCDQDHVAFQFLRCQFIQCPLPYLHTGSIPAVLSPIPYHERDRA